MIKFKEYKLRACGKRGYSITLPREVIEEMGVKLGDVMEMFIEDGKIVLQKGKVKK